MTSNLSDEGKAAVKNIISNGKLVVGTSADYAPCEFHTDIDGEDKIVGFEIDYVQFFADQMGVELEIVDMSFDNLLISLSKGDFDMVIASIAATPERCKAVDFSDGYYAADPCAIIRTEDISKFPDTASLKGKQIITQKGTTLEQVAVEVAGGEENVVYLNKVPDEVAELLGGKVDAVICDNLTAFGYDAMHEELTTFVVETSLVFEEAAVGIQKGNEGLVEATNYLLSLISDEQQVEWIKEAQILAGVLEE